MKTDNENKNEDMLSAIQTIFDEKIPFNNVLGLRVVSMDQAGPKVRFSMKDELIGNFKRGTLHGGVISSVIDVTGGLAAFIGVQQYLNHENLEKILESFARLSTIDLRVDYLRPGVGEHFVATGYLLRTGRKVAVIRVDLHNDKEQLIAVGTAAYAIA